MIKGMSKQAKFNTQWLFRGLFLTLMTIIFLAIIVATTLFIQAFLNING